MTTSATAAPTALAALVIAALAASGAPEAVTPSDRRDCASLDAALASLAQRHPKAVGVGSVGQSFGRRSIPVVTISADLATADSRPAVLVVSGMDGHRWSGCETTLAAIEALASGGAAWLRECTLYVIPRANPDPAEAFAHGPRRAYSGDALRHDNDRDVRMDEDGPVDLNGDGMITQIRALRPPFPWPAPTLVPDPADRRLLRAPDAAAGQVPEYTVWTEGFDQDGDGLLGEDWPGGFDPERNFPHRWPEFEDEAGVAPLIAPESVNLRRFVDAHRNVFAVLVIGRHDTVVRIPDPKEKTASGLPAMLHERDLDAYAAVARDWREASGQERAEGADTSGSLTAWLNVHRGIPAFATTLWGRPDVPAPKAEPSKEGGPPAPPAAPAPPAPADAEAAGWLAYSDAVRGGSGFVPWTPVKHPQLGTVEVGGWVPGFRENPPLEDIPGYGAKLVAFLGRLAERRPVVALAQPSVEEVAPGLLRISTRLENRGKLPTVQHAARSDPSVPQHVVRISVPPDRIRAGQRLFTARGIDPGASTELSWTVSVAPGEAVTLELAHAGRRLGGWRVEGRTASPLDAAALEGGPK